jgi:hypothetical protein
MDITSLEDMECLDGISENNKSLPEKFEKALYFLFLPQGRNI